MASLVIAAAVIVALVAASLWTVRRDDAGPQPVRLDYDTRHPKP